MGCKLISSLVVLIVLVASASGQKEPQCPPGCVKLIDDVKSDVQNLKTTAATIKVKNATAVPQKGGAPGVPGEVNLKDDWKNILLIQVAVGENVMPVPFAGDLQPPPFSQPSFQLPVPCGQNPALVQSGTLTVSISQRKLTAIASGCPTDMNVEVTLLLKK